MLNSVRRLSMTFLVFLLHIAKIAQVPLQVGLGEKYTGAKWTFEALSNFLLFSQNYTVEYLVDAYENSFSIKF
jgi:hypothetical protein